MDWLVQPNISLACQTTRSILAKQKGLVSSLAELLWTQVGTLPTLSILENVKTLTRIGGVQLVSLHPGSKLGGGICLALEDAFDGMRKLLIPDTERSTALFCGPSFRGLRAQQSL